MPFADKEKAREYKRRYYQANRAACLETSRDCKRARTYGVSPVQYADMLSAQDGRCAICKTDTPGGKGSWNIDHCHSSGRVRGILCHHCNIGLGNFRDNTAFLAEATSYLQRYQ